MNATARIGIKIIRLISGALDNLVLITIILLIAVGSYAIWDSKQVFERANAVHYEIYKPTEEADGGQSFAELRALNPDVFGWLTIYGTHIDYPVVQGDDNMKYINTNADGQYSLSGSIFLDHRNHTDFSDFSSIFYGHHMEKSAMFGDIGSFAEKSYFYERKYGNLRYQDREHGIEFFAFVHADAYDFTIFRTDIDGRDERQAYLDLLYSSATYARDIQVTIDDRIVLFSTCSSDSTNGRDILVGRISNEIFADTFVKTEPAVIKNIKAVDDLPGLWAQTPVWGKTVAIIVPLILLVLLAVFVIRKKRIGGIPIVKIFAIILACLIVALLAKPANAAANAAANTVANIATNIASNTAANAAANAEVFIPIRQELTSKDASEPPDNTFSYLLTPVSAVNPMPAGGGKTGYSLTLAGTATGLIGPIIFTKEGTYYYRFSHITDSRAGYVYDMENYIIRITVDKNLATAVIVMKDDGKKAGSLKYEHVYNRHHSLLPSDPELMADPPVVKTVSGLPPEESVFTFKLTAGNPANPMPEGSLNGVKTMQIKGSGTEDFGTWPYVKEGTYFYTITEVNTGLKEYAYDKTVYTITDTVTAEDSRLILTRVVKNSANKPVKSMSFINTYKGGTSGTGKNPGGGVKPVSPGRPEITPNVTPGNSNGTFGTNGAIGTGGSNGTDGSGGTDGADETDGTYGSHRSRGAGKAGNNGNLGNGVEYNHLGETDGPGGAGNHNYTGGPVIGGDNDSAGSGSAAGEGPKTGDDSNTGIFFIIFCAACAAALVSSVYLLTGKGRERRMRADNNNRKVFE